MCMWWMHASQSQGANLQALRLQVGAALERRAILPEPEVPEHILWPGEEGGSVKIVRRDFIYRKIIKPKRCATCGNKKSLVIHHISGNLQNNRKSNLIVLCCSCHMRVHSVIKKKFKELKPQRKNKGEKNCPYCKHKWWIKTKNPISCPRCKRRFDYEYLTDKYLSMLKKKDV